MPLNKQLLKILICPQCRGKVRFDEKENCIICDQCKLIYEIKDDIPVMLVEEAKKIS
ncbi:MAG: Trm112 family protein [Smithella sp.]